VVPYSARREALEALKRVLTRYAPRMVAAANADFGCRSEFTTRVGDLFTMQSELSYMLRALPRWTKPERRHTELMFRFGRGHVERQALGVVAVIAPWNYPFRLTFGPLAAAIAAGNRVLVKPSELTPACADLMATMVAEALSPNHAQVLLGGRELCEALCQLPLDHIFFTGSAAVGRAVLENASANLTPVTLELGGKCPAIIHRGYPLGHAIARVLTGKLFNAGQTCVAPDHLWVHRTELEPALAELRLACQRLYPRLADNEDYTSIINRKHYERLVGLVSDAARLGANVEVLNPANEVLPESGRKLAPTLVWNLSERMALASEEVFGPVLPIHVYDTLDQLLAELREKPAPLALYYFDDDRSRARSVVAGTTSGGVCLNDVVLQGLQNDLPFGGVGASGMGKYHAVEGFECFSHARAVFRQGRLNGVSLLIPEYGRVARALVAWLSR
jgi:acyl-CoA reductase-like NAD-dependent aldehyde dehydrogenase